MIQIFYGYGKGKTSIINGSALRMINYKWKIGYFRFLKGQPSGENTFLSTHPQIDFISLHPNTKFTRQMNDQEKAETLETIDKTFNLIIKNKHKYNAILLDELLDLVITKFKTEDQIIALLDQIPQHVEVLITGHEKLTNVFAKADLITYCKKEKHYFDQKVAIREGIEY